MSRDNWEASFSSENDNWGTPPELMEALAREGITFDIDLAAVKATAKAPLYLGPDHPREQLRDGLNVDIRMLLKTELRKTQDHTVRGWLNAPYSRISAFTEMAFNESRSGRGRWHKDAPVVDESAAVWMQYEQNRRVPLLEVWSLCFARTDTAWWHDYCARAAEITFLKGRLPFIDPETGMPRRNKKTGHIQCATAPSALVVFRPGHQGPPVVLHRDLLGKRRKSAG